MVVAASVFFATGCVSKGVVTLDKANIDADRFTGFGSGDVRESYSKTSLVYRYAQAAVKSESLGKQVSVTSNKALVGAGAVGAQIIDGSGFTTGMGMMMLGASVSDSQIRNLVTYEQAIFSSKPDRVMHAFWGLYEDTGSDAMLDALKNIRKNVKDICFEQPGKWSPKFTYTRRVTGSVNGKCGDYPVAISMVRVVHKKHFGKQHQNKIFVSVRAQPEVITAFQKAYQHDKTKGVIFTKELEGELKVLVRIADATVVFDPPRKK